MIATQLHALFQCWWNVTQETYKEKYLATCCVAVQKVLLNWIPNSRNCARIRHCGSDDPKAYSWKSISMFYQKSRCLVITFLLHSCIPAFCVSPQRWDCVSPTNMFLYPHSLNGTSEDPIFIQHFLNPWLCNLSDILSTEESCEIDGEAQRVVADK